jgi:hypothetical protein
VNGPVDGQDARVVGIIRTQALKRVRQWFDNDTRAQLIGHEPIEIVVANAVVRADLHELETVRLLRETVELALKPRNAFDPITRGAKQLVEQFSHGLVWVIRMEY